MNNENRWSKKKLQVSLFLILLGIAYYIELRTFGFGIPCYFNLITGLKCPGCGITRMAVSILQGNVKEAFQFNMGLTLLSPVMLPYLGVCWYRWITDRSNNVKIINQVGVVFVIFLIIWTIFRNLYGY